MNSTPQLPSKDDPHHPLNHMPIPELKADLSNFTQWMHAVGFHLRYHGLLDYASRRTFSMIQKPKPSTEEERQTREKHSLHVYSLIAAKIENITPYFKKVMGRDLFHDEYECFHYDPMQLWDDIHEFRRLARHSRA